MSTSIADIPHCLPHYLPYTTHTSLSTSCMSGPIAHIRHSLHTYTTDACRNVYHTHTCMCCAHTYAHAYRGKLSCMWIDCDVCVVYVATCITHSYVTRLPTYMTVCPHISLRAHTHFLLWFVLLLVLEIASKEMVVAAILIISLCVFVCVLVCVYTCLYVYINLCKFMTASFSGPGDGRRDR